MTNQGPGRFRLSCMVTTLPSWCALTSEREAGYDFIMERFTYTVNIEPAEEGGYNAFVPALPGCQTQAEAYQEAVAMATECIEGFREALVKAGAKSLFENSRLVSSL